MKPKIEFFEVKESSSKGVKTIALKPKIEFFEVKESSSKEVKTYALDAAVLSSNSL